MFDNYIFTEGSARNVVEDGKVTAFEVQTLIAYYRGVPMSMIHDVELEVDGTQVPTEELLISVDGKEWFTLREAETVTTRRWEYGDQLSVRWAKEGGLPAGSHEVTLRVRIRVAYIPIPFGGERTRTVEIAA